MINITIINGKCLRRWLPKHEKHNRSLLGGKQKPEHENLCFQMGIRWRSLGTGARAAARQGVKNENPGRGWGPSREVDTKMSQIDPRLRP